MMNLLFSPNNFVVIYRGTNVLNVKVDTKDEKFIGL